MPKTQVHPTAIIESGAELDEGVQVGAYAWIGAQTHIGRDTIIHHHATVDGRTSVGVGNEVFPYAFIGGKTQDLKYQGESPGLAIGNHNTFREYVSVHLATHEGDATKVGDENVILAYCHIAHECSVGNRNIMSSHSALGGHVQIEDHVNIGWGIGIHQFCRMGKHAMAGACSKVVQDILPFMIADGNPAAVRTINKIGMKRANYDEGTISRLHQAYQILYKQNTNRKQAIETLRNAAINADPQIQHLVAFAVSSERGLA